MLANSLFKKLVAKTDLFHNVDFNVFAVMFHVDHHILVCCIKDEIVINDESGLRPDDLRRFWCRCHRLVVLKLVENYTPEVNRLCLMRRVNEVFI